MKNTLKAAVEANDLPKIRETLVKIIRSKSDKSVSIDSVTEVIQTTPGLFDKDNGKFYADKAENLTAKQLDEIADDLKSNFSLEKFRLLTEAYAILAESPDYYADKKQKATAKETVAKSDCCKSGKKKSVSCGKVFGAIVMALGCAAAIVGLCVPVKFLLGLGIGIFMLGTAFVYINIRS